MRKDTRLILFILLVSVTAILLIIYRYEKLLRENDKNVLELAKVINDNRVKEFSDQEIIKLIMGCPEYLQDTIVLLENGNIKSSNSKLNGTISSVMGSQSNMDLVKADMKLNKLPIQYNVYRIAAIFYKRQYINSAD